MAAQRSDSPSATSGKGRDPGYVEVDGSGKPVGTADELDEATRRQVRQGATLTADERTAVREAKAEPTPTAEKPTDDVEVQFARPGDRDEDGEPVSEGEGESEENDVFSEPSDEEVDPEADEADEK